MPIYEYACSECQHTLDALQKMSDQPLKDCPECGKPALKRLISAPRFRLKGQGWYETDFKTGNKRNLTEGESKTSSTTSTTDKSESSKSDSSKSDSPKTESKSPPASTTGSSKTAEA